MEYSQEQIGTLKELRKRFAERGFTILGIKARHRKHEDEFVFAKPEDINFDTGIVRLYRGSVRIQFFEFEKALLKVEVEYVTRRLPLIIFADKPLNHYKRIYPKRFWTEFTYKTQLEEGKAL